MILQKKEERNLTTYNHNGIKVATMYSTVQYNVRKYKVELHFLGNKEKTFYGVNPAERYIIKEFMNFIKLILMARENRYLYISPINMCLLNKYIYEFDWIDDSIIIDLFNNVVTYDGRTWNNIT